MARDTFFFLVSHVWLATLIGTMLLVEVGDPEHLKVFATTDAAETWFEENDPEGVAFEYEVGRAN